MQSLTLTEEHTLRIFHTESEKQEIWKDEAYRMHGRDEKCVQNFSLKTRREDTTSECRKGLKDSIKMNPK
jgi:hypothetical protein